MSERLFYPPDGLTEDEQQLYIDLILSAELLIKNKTGLDIQIVVKENESIFDCFKRYGLSIITSSNED